MWQTTVGRQFWQLFLEWKVEGYHSQGCCLIPYGVQASCPVSVPVHSVDHEELPRSHLPQSPELPFHYLHPFFCFPGIKSLDMAFHKANLARCSWEQWLWVYEGRLSSSLGTITHLGAIGHGDVGLGLTFWDFWSPKNQVNPIQGRRVFFSMTDFPSPKQQDLHGAWSRTLRVMPCLALDNFVLRSPVPSVLASDGCSKKLPQLVV